MSMNVYEQHSRHPELNLTVLSSEYRSMIRQQQHQHPTQTHTHRLASHDAAGYASTIHYCLLAIETNVEMLCDLDSFFAYSQNCR